MKYLVKIALGLFVYMAVVASCKDDDDSGITGFSIDKEDITMGAGNPLYPTWAGTVCNDSASDWLRQDDLHRKAGCGHQSVGQL